LIVIAALVVATWSAVFILRGSLAIGCLLFLLTVACLGLRTFNLGLGQFELGHAVLALLIVAFFIQQQRGLTGSVPLNAADYALLAFLTMITITTFNQPMVTPVPPLMM